MNLNLSWKDMALVGFLALASSMAQADPAPVQVNALELRNLPRNANQAVSVFYAVGSSQTFAATGTAPHVRMIVGGPIGAQIRADGTAAIPQGSAARKGFQILNYLVFVIHRADQENVHLCNSDREHSIPSDDGVSHGNCDLDYLNSIRMIFRPVRLNSAKTGITQIGTTTVTSDQPVSIDLGNP